ILRAPAAARLRALALPRVDPNGTPGTFLRSVPEGGSSISRRKRMSELIVVGFDSTDEADRVLTELGRLQKEHLVDLEDAVVAIRDTNGKLRLKQSVPLVGIGAASGGMWGALWGSLVGLLFLNPLL